MTRYIWSPKNCIEFHVIWLPCLALTFMNQFVWSWAHFYIRNNNYLQYAIILHRNLLFKLLSERKKKPREYIHTAMAVSVIPYGERTMSLTSVSSAHVLNERDNPNALCTNEKFRKRKMVRFSSRRMRWRLKILPKMPKHNVKESSWKWCVAQMDRFLIAWCDYQRDCCMCICAHAE